MSQPSQLTDADGNPSRIAKPPRADVPIVSRGEFVRKFGKEYGPGQHVSMIGPTQRGKTYLCHELLKATISPDHKAVILAGKPPHRDGTMSKAAEKLNLRIVEEWPPIWSPKDRKRNGYVLRPHQSLSDLDADDKNLHDQYKAAMMQLYRSKKPVITVADEAHHVQNDLKLRKEYEAVLMRGAPHNAMWSLIQRGRFMSYQAYDAPEHIFLFYDPDQANQKRYSEIGGIDPRHTRELVADLRTYRVQTNGKPGGTISECLYIKRSGPEIYIVDVA